MKKFLTILSITGLFFLFSCGESANNNESEETDTVIVEENVLKIKTEQFTEVKLTADLSHLSDNQKTMLGLLIDAAGLMEEIYWKESYGDKNELLDSLEDEYEKKFALINFGPWDRLNGNLSFIEKIGDKPKGAQFYPADITEEEFKKFEDENKKSLYTLIQRDEEGKLKSVWYHEAFKEQVDKAAELIKKAAELAEDKGFKKYLKARAEALLTDKYFDSDIAWMEMETNPIDFIVGPIENYEDALFGCKAAHESFLLIKDIKWSEKLKRLTALLPEMQKVLPVEQAYKDETPGTSGNQLNVYDAVFYAGDCNAGSKTIAINLPNDEKVRETKGSRKLQLKNTMKAKFDKILVPISKVLIDEEQQKHVKFDAFFTNTMFHEVAHGLGLGYTIKNKKLKVREALQGAYTSIEEGKADILGLYIVNELFDRGELEGDTELMDYYVTFFTSTFRSVRFGVSSAHGKANMMRFYYFKEKGAFTVDPEKGTYKIDFEKMKVAVKDLVAEILIIQGDGDYKKAIAWIEKDGQIREGLQKDLDRINEAGIPKDIVFVQGKEVLGL